jgi:hypothetical protein
MIRKDVVDKIIIQLLAVIARFYENKQSGVNEKD